jgi:pyridoxal phosphate enzyme (YggS family)
MSIGDNIRNTQEKIRDYEKKFDRIPHSVKCLLASKAQPIEKISQAIQAGMQVFGENYLQEALLKIAALSSEKIEWHFIGHIQSNKTRKIAENFAWVQSISSSDIAKRLNDQRPDGLPPLNICLEINIDDEPLKSGVLAKDVLSLADYCRSLPRLTLRGLMAIPAPQDHFADQCIAFRKMKLLFDSLNEKNFALDTLSMGMTQDMEAAIAEGSTMVRVGTGIFGLRS